MEEQVVPSRRKCGAAAAYYLAVEAQPEYRQRQRELEAGTARRMALGPEALAPEAPITIPVVVHVVYNEDSENISDEQIESQITVLNQDFGAENADTGNVPDVWQGLVTDTNIQFAIASEDPAGDSTSGITRTQTDRPGFGIDDSVKSADTGGVVILNTAFGTTGTAAAPFDLGRTATHEVGHFFNLYHIWGLNDDCTGGDRVPDTPNAEGPNYGEPTFPHISCNNGPYGDMFMNYMDYVDDRVMCMFTAQQVARMMATLDGPRSGLGRS